MMKLIGLISFLFINCLSNAQTSNASEKLYFFKTNDGLVGVRNALGKVILKPRLTYGNYDDNYKHNPVFGHLIYLDGHTDSIREPHSWGVAYSNKGKILFAPFAFDNGPDGFAEGLSRFVKNGKVGFVNRHGDIVIDAIYDYAGVFNYGTVTYCNGCTWKDKSEHAFVTGGTWGYLDYRGNKVNTSDKKLSDRDQAVDSGRFLPYQFSYSAFEQKIIDSFYKLKDINKACFVRCSSLLDSSERILRYEIVERPSSFFPYYYVAAFSYDKSGEYSGNPFGGLNFCVDKKGNNFFYFDAGEMIPLKPWLEKYIENAKAYLKKHPDASYEL